MHVHDLLREMVERDASDLYVKVGSPPTFRVHGELQPGPWDRVTPEASRALADQLLDDEQRHQLRTEQNVDLAYSFPGVGRFRVNIYQQRGSIAFVARRVRTDIPSFQQLGLPEILAELVMRPRGLVFVTGPTGSGKTTTLAAMIDYRNTHASGHIITIEDPIEFLHPDKRSLVSQREVATDTPSFPHALRGALRQAPDVLLIGEMRDRESADAALYFAETGHLVLSTLHSINASQTLERLLAFFPMDQAQEVLHRVSLTLEGIISQRLVPRSDGQGRVVAVEVLVATPRIRELIRRGDFAGIKVAIQAGGGEGMQTFDQALYDLYQKGLISMEDALRAADSPNDLRLRIRGLA
ncbi:MAG: type IV pilus twitching motility protein PilT [Armatimonadota bacterium]|nr:type IV pilus twitching motility protein PilT [Armatimonadota bacterium]MDR7438511.1 type IV pilus twitching motility protein PilT [Armatimonadota bacterium]MDR7562319.1 type IV pilus twitching motility protein PilT [Armatimonadota bacterium]MDR7568105.1 type IV pilus twitching motility protein PilT [Armatimonadota bacterium]